MTKSLAESAVVTALRRILLALLVLGVLGVGVELLLLGHTEELLQLSPLILLGVTLLALVLLLVRPDRVSLLVFRVVMCLLVMSGPVGLYLHYAVNVEFELEMYASLGGLQLFWEAIQGATPALAPATMIQLGLLGLGYTFRHPLLRRSTGQAPPAEGETP